MTSNHSERQGLPAEIRRLIIKVGSRILVDEEGRPDIDKIGAITRQIIELHREGREVILVTSGAIAAGVQRLGWNERPTQLPDLQMAAAVGQSVLMHQYNRFFSEGGCIIGQVLLTHADLTDRGRHLNARNTILAMLRNGVIPVVNENDVVAVDEIRFGDNDLLASMVSSLVDADLLVLLTTADGLHRVEGDEMKERIPLVKRITDEILDMARGKGSSWSSGGMASKLKAARIAASSGTPVVIANGNEEGVLRKILDEKDTGTLILPANGKQRLNARKKWMAFFHRPKAGIVVDEGAVDAIRNRGNSLLPVGIVKTFGRFEPGSLVNVQSPEGQIIARGITSYSREEIERIKGRRSAEIAAILGENHYFEEVIHRDNMVIMEQTNE